MIIVPYTQGAASPSEIARACQPFGGVIFVVDEQDPAAVSHLPALQACGLIASAGGGAAEVTALLGAGAADGIVTFAEATIGTTVQLAEAFGLPYHSRDTALYLQDKLAQRERLNAAGVGHVPVRAVTIGPDQPVPDPAMFPLVVKPRSGCGSEHTVVVRNPAQFREQTGTLDPGRSYLAEGYLADGPPPLDWLGNYLSVESEVSAAGIVHHGITGRLPLAAPVRETGAVFPLSLPADQAAELEQLAERAIHALDIRLGLVHTEIKLTPDGPRIIEVNGRLGGRLNQMMRMVGRREPVAAAVSTAARAPVEPLAPCTGVALSYWLQPPVTARGVATLPAVRELTALPDVVIAKQIRGPGQPVDWRLGTGSLAVEVWMRAPSLGQLQVSFQKVQAVLDAAVSWS